MPAIEPSPETVADRETGCAHEQEPEEEKPRRRRNYTWAELMKRVWAFDVLECSRCSGRMRLVAAIHAEEALHRILECLGLPSCAPPLFLPRIERYCERHRRRGAPPNAT